eukprot:3734432-Amphidinium_carterae.1
MGPKSCLSLLDDAQGEGDEKMQEVMPSLKKCGVHSGAEEIHESGPPKPLLKASTGNPRT